MKPTILSGSATGPTVESGDLDIHLQHTYYSIISFDNSVDRIPVTPTAGTYLIESSETGLTWGIVDTINAADTGPLGTYARPTASGSLKRTRITPTGVDVAGFFEMSVNAFAE